MEASFKVGDIVCVGDGGDKGKIIEVLKPLGTYDMYKGMSLYSGEIVTASKTQLVKGCRTMISMKYLKMRSMLVMM